ncbi:MAG: Fic family protein [Deltaproteobacteria bacterium]|nr:Fic family protein [Deltaproteobacteria bacterium]
MNQLYLEIDRKAELVRGRLSVDEKLAKAFSARLDQSWIYHDNALEGVVLAFHELNAALDERIVSDNSLIATYDDVTNHKMAIEFVRQSAIKRKPALGLDYLKKLHHILSQEHSPRPGKAPPRPPAGQYRKDNPLHRMYFHEIAAPEKISYQMRKFVGWLTSDESKKMPVVKRAAVAQHKLISIFPWPRHSGKVARLLMNAILMREGFAPSIVHAIDRQRYYEVLKQSPEALTTLVAEALDRTLGSAVAFTDSPPEDLDRIA